MYQGTFDKHGIGLSAKDYTASIRTQGVMDANQVWIEMINGNMKMPVEDVVKDHGKKQFTPEPSKVSKVEPILTRQGKITFVLIALSFVGYIMYQKFKAEKDAEMDSEINNEVDSTSQPIQPSEPNPPAPSTPAESVG